MADVQVFLYEHGNSRVRGAGPAGLFVVTLARGIALPVCLVCVFFHGVAAWPLLEGHTDHWLRQLPCLCLTVLSIK
mgnify:FL=1